MKIILTDDVVGLGDIGETVSVKPGYARNYLIPRGLAMEAESVSAKQTQHRMKQIEAKKRRMRSGAEAVAERLRAAAVILELRVGEHGRVFGSVTARDIAEKLTQLGFELDRRRVLLPEPIRKLGSHPVKVRLHQDVETVVDVVVNPREATKNEIEAEVGSARASLERGAAARAEVAGEAATAESAGEQEAGEQRSE